MSIGGGNRTITASDIQIVQNLIERCLQLYMTKSEAVSKLLKRAKIETVITENVWDRLEMENPEFFQAYNLRLEVIEQISIYNAMLKRQKELMERAQSAARVAAVPPTNGFLGRSLPTNSVYQAPYHPARNMMYPPLSSTTTMPSTNIYTNGVNMGGHAGRIPFTGNMPLAQNMNAGMMYGMNGGMVNPGGHMGNSPVEDENHKYIVESYNPPYIVGNPSLQTLNDDIVVNPVFESFDIPQNMSISDLTDSFSNGDCNGNGNGNVAFQDPYLGSSYMGAVVNDWDYNWGSQTSEVQKGIPDTHWRR